MVLSAYVHFKKILHLTFFIKTLQHSIEIAGIVYSVVGINKCLRRNFPFCGYDSVFLLSWQSSNLKRESEAVCGK